jgi:PRTRC genetic system ThiF family protein
MIKYPDWWNRQKSLTILLAGAGGNGSHILSILARMHVALRELGNAGFHVTVADPDTVSSANVGRQLFSPSDVGHFKSVVLTHRVNQFFGLDWTAHPSGFETAGKHYHLIIGCLDTVAARKKIAETRPADYWLDLGNNATSGQAVLGSLKGPDDWIDRAYEYAEGALPKVARIPHVLDLFPNMSTNGESKAPSCSLAESLKTQDFLINQTLACHAADILWRWIRNGSIVNNGSFVNLQSGQVRALPADVETWMRLAANKGNASVRKAKKKRK